MNITSIRIITTDVIKLMTFYENITNLSAIYYTPDFAELKTEAATLAIGSTNTLQFFGGNEVAMAAQNKSTIIEFKSANVDDDYLRLEEFLKPFILQKPTLMPWGNKSLLFRDPDGNLVNIFTPITNEALNRINNS